MCTGGWDSLNDSVLPFTFHTRALLGPPGGGGGKGCVEEVCVRGCGLFFSREKEGAIHSEDAIIIRLPCFGFTLELRKKTVIQNTYMDKCTAGLSMGFHDAKK